MVIYFKRLLYGWPDNYRPPQDHEDSWRIYTVCISSANTSCTTRADVQALASSDKVSARSTFVSFSLKAQTGKPLTELYGEKQCHEAHAFKLHEHDQTPTKIWRIWSAGKIRVYFVYLPNKRLAILKTCAKRQDKLDKGEKLELELLAGTVLRCLESHTFDTLEIHD